MTAINSKIQKMTHASRLETLHHARMALQSMHDLNVSDSRSKPFESRENKNTQISTRNPFDRKIQALNPNSNHILSKYKSSDYPASLLSSNKSYRIPLINNKSTQFYNSKKGVTNYRVFLGSVASILREGNIF